MEAAATYRLQLDPDHDLDHAAGLVDYLADLGITHIYCSPFLQSAPDAPHGYAVVDYLRVDDRLGGEPGRRRLVAAASAAGLDLVVDLVPNHMAVSLPANGWLWDVLEHGYASPYATHFDIDWDTARHSGVRLPLLGDYYQREVEAGAISLRREDGRLVIRYYEHVLPLSPGSVAAVLEMASAATDREDLAAAARELRSLPPAEGPPERRLRAARARRIRDRLRDLLAAPEAGAAVDRVVDHISSRPDSLDALLRRQPYRLVFWQTAGQALDYRRFFDIDTLIGMRVEDPDVFEDIHRLVLDWVAAGEVGGLRIDHPDGLRDPGGYLSRLRAHARGAWIVVEKILESDESIPTSWPVAGTTGYDFLSDMTTLLVDPTGADVLARLWTTMSGSEETWEEVADRAKRHALDEVLGADLNRLTQLLAQVVAQVVEAQEETPGGERSRLSAALIEMLAAFDVYRTYVPEEGGPSPSDAERVASAAQRARRRAPHLSDLVDILESVLTGQAGEVDTELRMRFQQLSGPVMAKGVEDTAFYRYLALAALCEVGGDPGRFGFCGPDPFHRRRRETQEGWPATMLALTTHDTKRSEDVRARLAVLSEVPEEWEERVLRWRRMNRRHRPSRLDGATEYLMYQTLVGAHPLPLARLLRYMEKAVREAKTHTSWTHPDPGYERGVEDFARAVHGDDEFQADLAEFASPLVEAGRINSLIQKTVQLTAPGVPDTYQGTELWDLSLVDPDNRRPVDYARRRSLLASLGDIHPAEVLEGMDEGLPKLWLLHTLLQLRRRRPAAMGTEGGYRPLAVAGPAARHAVAYTRGEEVAVVVPRLTLRLQREGGWNTTRLELPGGTWTGVFDGARHRGTVEVAELTESFPVSVLERA
ncbi:MAG: malto-oligosyltrehalose synthase [Actinomycetota bacterium]